MFDVLAFPVPPCPVEARLRAPLVVGTGDETGFVCLGRTVHLCRSRRCGWHLVLHRDREGGCWTHLYRVVAEPGGGVAVLLDRAVPGDGRRQLCLELRLREAGTDPALLPPSDPRQGLRGWGLSARSRKDAPR